MSRFSNWVRQVATKLAFPGMGGSTAAGHHGWGWWNWGRRLPGSQHDYRSEAGMLHQNSIVYACLAFIGSSFCEADMCLEKRGLEDGIWKPFYDHPFLDLIRSPNPYYQYSTLMSSALLSVETFGNGYIIIERGKNYVPKELWYIPHWMIWPVWDKDGKHFIEYYAYRVNGKHYKIAVENVIHLRSKFLDPTNPRMGISPLEAVLREVVTDNEASTFMAAVLRNQGFPGMVISPKNEIDVLTPAQRDDLRRQFEEFYTGDGRGMALIQSIPIQIDTPSYTPEQLVLEKTRGISEERVCAVLEIPPGVVQMGAGLRATSNRGSHRDARRQAVENKIIPLQTHIAEQITRQLLIEFEDIKHHRVAFDRRNVLALQEDRNEKARRTTLAVGGPWMTVNEARAEEGLPPIDGGDILRQPKSGQDGQSQIREEDDLSGAADTPKEGRDKSDDGVDR